MGIGIRGGVVAVVIDRKSFRRTGETFACSLLAAVPGKGSIQVSPVFGKHGHAEPGMESCSGNGLVYCRDDPFLEMIGIQDPCVPDLFQIAAAGGVAGAFPRPVQRWQQHRRQNRNDRYTATLKMAFFLLFSAVFAFSFFDEKTLNTQIPNVTFRMIF